jgi:large subunit ribosomal protein L10
MAAAAARFRKGLLLDAARRALREPALVAVGALVKADVPAVRAARDAYRAAGFEVKKLPNRLCRLAVADSDRAFLAGLFAGDLVVLYTTEEGADAGTLARKLLKATDGAGNVRLLGGALDDMALYASDFEALRDAPSLHDARASVARALREPAARTARALRRPGVLAGRLAKAPLAKVGRGVRAWVDRLGEDPA